MSQWTQRLQVQSTPEPAGTLVLGGEMRPCVAAIGGFVNSEARFRISRRIRLAGSCIKGVAVGSAGQ